MVHCHRARARGFTLLELLVVISVISTLALIVIPRVSGATRKGREAAMAANLYQLRQAINRFQADTGLYPASLTDLVRPAATPPTQGYTSSGQLEPLPTAALYNGPYLMPYTGIANSGLPYNPVLDDRAKQLDDQWQYRFDAAKNEAIVSCPTGIGSTMLGVPYENL